MVGPRQAFTFLDVGGYNYQLGQYERDHQKFPNRIIVGTESYPKDIANIWRIVEKNPYVLGDFVWTCMDYLGEAGTRRRAPRQRARGVLRRLLRRPGHLRFQEAGVLLPRRGLGTSANWRCSCIARFRKAAARSVAGWGWPDELASWTWPGSEGKPMQVNVYSQCDSVRLELNGKEIATKQINGGRLTARFEVPYAAGELKAVGLKNGKIVATKVLRTRRPREEDPAHR